MRGLIPRLFFLVYTLIQSVDFLSTLYSTKVNFSGSTLYHTKVKISTPTFPPSNNTRSSYTHITGYMRASCNPRATILYKLRPAPTFDKSQKICYNKRLGYFHAALVQKKEPYRIDRVPTRITAVSYEGKYETFPIRRYRGTHWIYPPY